jgi:hypothetical protein
MSDYTWPSVYFAYLFFALSAALCVFFFIRSWKDGYWGDGGEEIKYQLFDEPSASTEETPHGTK